MSVTVCDADFSVSDMSVTVCDVAANYSDMPVTVCDVDFTESDMSVTVCDGVKRTSTCLSRSVGQAGGVVHFSRLILQHSFPIVFSLD
jgi:hypothetical protein